MTFLNPAFLLLIGILEIVLAVILIRRRDFMGWLLLAGALLHTLAQLGIHWLFQLYNNTISSLNSPPETFLLIQILGPISAFGGLLFFAGILIHALKRRALHKRLAELEQVLAARDVADL